MQEILSVDVEETHVEEIHRVMLIACMYDLLAIVGELACVKLRVGPDDLAVADC